MGNDSKESPLQRLIENQTKYAEAQKHMDGKLDTLQSDIHEIREALLGHAGDVTKPGLVVRLDRVEQALPENLKERLTKLEDKIANRDKFLWMLISVVVTLVATRAWELIK